MWSPVFVSYIFKICVSINKDRDRQKVCVSSRLNSPVCFLMLPVPIRETTLHPTDKIFLKNGMSLNSGRISFVILIINLYGGVVRHFLFVVFKRNNILTVPCFTLCNSVTVVCVVIALHNKILTTAFALSEANILFKHFCKFKFKCFPDVPEFITYIW